MRTIRRYKLERTNYQQIKIPVRSNLLSVQGIGGELYAWIEVDTTEKEYLTFFDVKIVGTGDDLEFLTSLNPLLDERPYRFLSTVIDVDRLWHIYWR